MEKSKKKKVETFGWDVFNDDSLLKAHTKKCKDLPFYKDHYEKEIETGNSDLPDEFRLQKL